MSGQGYAGRKMMDSTIKEQIKAAFDGLTKSERKLAAHLLSNYPVAALGSITALAKAAEVSTPTAMRLVHKLGYRGYPEFQAGLRGEVEERLMSPLVKHDRWAEGAPDTHILNRFADAVVSNLHGTLAQIDHAEFDRVAALLADNGRRVYALGGRITHALADYFVTHMTVMRPGVSLISDMSNAWPPALIDLGPGDVLLAFDIRRYENKVLQVVELAKEQGAVVVLVTDQWVSPAAAHADFRLSAQIEAPSAWDSTISIMVLIETLLAAVQDRDWDGTQARMRRLEHLYDRSRFFRRTK